MVRLPALEAGLLAGSTPAYSTNLRLCGPAWSGHSPFVGEIKGSNPFKTAVLVAYLVKVLDCESGEQGSNPADTQK